MSRIFDDGPEELNGDGETFQVIIARAHQMISLGPATLSLLEAISAAEEVVSTKINWTNGFNRSCLLGHDVPSSRFRASDRQLGSFVAVNFNATADRQQIA